MIGREAIFAALFAQVTAALTTTPATFATMSRRLQPWEQVSPPDQPALFQVEGKQTADARPGLPTRWTLRAELCVYVHDQSPNPGALDTVTRLNTAVDAIVNALLPDISTNRQTLGGIVHDCKVKGDIDTDEGRLGSQAVAIIPIEILTP